MPRARKDPGIAFKMAEELNDYAIFGQPVYEIPASLVILVGSQLPGKALPHQAVNPIGPYNKVVLLICAFRRKGPSVVTPFQRPDPLVDESGTCPLDNEL